MLAPAVALAIVGTVVTAVVTGLAAAWLFDFSTTEGLLVGAIVAGTDGAAIFALLRGSTLRRRLARTLEGESGLNDPVAVLLVLGFIHHLQNPDYGLLDFAGLFAQQLAIGAAVGAGGRLRVHVRAARGAAGDRRPLPGRDARRGRAGVRRRRRRARLRASWRSTWWGLTLGTATIPAKQTIATFHEGMAWVAQLSMFLVLGLLIFPSDLGGGRVRGHGAGARAGVRRAAAGDRPVHRAVRVLVRASRRCSAGRG